MTTPTPEPAPAPQPVLPPAVSPSVTGEITLTLTAVATIIAFIWHKDYSSLVPALGTVATAIVGAALAIESAVKHRTHSQAVSAYNHALLESHYANTTTQGTLVARSIA